MTFIFVILIIIAAVILGFIVLVQNPKGGGLSGNIAGFSNQFMGVKQTTDVLEKGTWIFAAVIAILCIASTFFIRGGGTVQDRVDKIENGPVRSQPLPQTAPTTTNTTTLPSAQPAQGDTTK